MVGWGDRGHVPRQPLSAMGSGNLLSWLKLLPGKARGADAGSGSCCHGAAAPSVSSHVVTLAVPQLQLPGGGRAGHQPWHRGELEGLKPGWHPAWITPQPHCKQQLCRDLWEAGPGLLLSKGHRCPGAGLAVSVAFSSAELTSTFTSNPLLFPGSFPVSQLSVSELAAQPLLTRFLVTKNTLSHHGAFPRHFSPIFHQRGACRVCVPTLIPGECFCQSLSHPGPVPGRQELAPCPLPACGRCCSCRMP